MTPTLHLLSLYYGLKPAMEGEVMDAFRFLGFIEIKESHDYSKLRIGFVSLPS